LTVSLAARERRTVWLRYRSGTDEDRYPYHSGVDADRLRSARRSEVETERLVDPYGVVYRSGRWYTAGHCHLRNDTRLFRLDRVVEAQIREESFNRPDDFDCLAYVIRSIALLPGRYDLDVLIHAPLDAARALILPGAGTLDEVPGGVALRGFTQDVDWMAHYLASLPWTFQVRQPDELREALRRHAAAMLAAAGSPESVRSG
jgi:predicted DNA-binding transcriptional regulator YafY